MLKSKLTRRRLLSTTAAATAAIAMPHVRGAHAAGKLSLGFWDHWVPGANNTTTALVNEWAAKEKVEVSVDYITSQGNKNLLTIAAEAQARSGHDVFQFPTWQPADHANRLDPVDEIMAELIKQNGAVNPTVEYLARADDLMRQHAGIDVVAMYPSGAPPKAEAWTLDAFLKGAEACHKAGFPFGIGLGTTEDNVDTAGAIFQSFGANLVDAKGDIAVKTDSVRQALEFYKKLAQWLPPDAPAWDNASNNKYLIAGKGALIMNPPSAWAVAKRDAPKVAEQLWTHGMPAGPKGRYAPFLPYFYGIWNFSKNRSAAKSLLLYLSQPSAVEKMVNASAGYDLPAFEKLTTFKVWAEESPPKGTLYHYPNPYNHQILSVAAQPAPPKIAVQIYTQAIQTKMVVRFMQGEPLEKTLAWAETEVEGFMRT